MTNTQSRHVRPTQVDVTAGHYIPKSKARVALSPLPGEYKQLINEISELFINSPYVPKLKPKKTVITGKTSPRLKKGIKPIKGDNSSRGTNEIFRERLLDLSKPKEPKIAWWTNVGPNVMWGTQEMLWPIPKKSLQAEASQRISELSTPKKNFQTGNHAGRPLFYYSCGRPSMIWEIGGKDIPEASERVGELSNPKRTHPEYKDDKDEVTWEEYVKLYPKRQYLYSCGRVSPIWKVSKNAQSAGDRPRTQQLSMPRPPHNEFQPSRQVETIIPTHALSANATERLQYLSTPKRRPEGPFREPEWAIADTVKNANASNRSLELARPKGVVDGYQLPRDEMWPVSRAAKRTSATQRIQELSRPIVRASMDHVQFNPEAFVVKQTALKGVIPRRVEELAQPITRG